MRSDDRQRADRAEGRRRATRMLDRLAARRRVVVLLGRRALLERLLASGTASADDVREAIEVPVDVDPICLGAVPGPLASVGIVASDGFAMTSRPSAHARPVTVWRLVDRAKVVQWLQEHDVEADSAERPRATPGGGRRECDVTQPKGVGIASGSDSGTSGGSQRMLFDGVGPPDNKKPDGGNRRGGGR